MKPNKIVKANFFKDVVKPTPEGRSGNMAHFFNFVLKLRETGLVRWAMKFLKIHEAPPFIRYFFVFLLLVFPYFAASLGFLVMKS